MYRLFLILTACTAGSSADAPGTPGADDTDDTDVPTGETASGTTPTADTATPYTTPTGAASCALSAANPLRVECTATLAAIGNAVLELSASGVPTRTFASDAAAMDHDLLGWGLTAGTTYDWTLAGAMGQVTTGAIPADLAAATITTTGTLFGIDAVLQPIECGPMYFVMIDGDGAIIWYEAAAAYASRQNGYEWSQDTRSVMNIDAGTFVDQHVSGAELMRLERGLDFDDDLHHDMARLGDLTYLLFEEPVGPLNVDGVYVFDGSTLVDTFRMADLWTIPGNGMGDWGHANGLNVSDTAELVMSVHAFDTVIGIDGDPTSATFLDLTFLAEGGTSEALPNPTASPTYVPASGAREGFDGQHNASRHGTDELWMFDNLGGGTGSRGARYLLDGGTGEVRLDAEWILDDTCTIQGGAVPIPGGVLVTCGNQQDIYAFADGATTAAWEMNAGCGETDTMIRGIPVFVR